MTANIEKLDRPFTVGFSPDLPGIRDAYCVDAWVRTSPIESLFFNPKTGRWQAQNLTFGVGAAFIPGALVTFRAVPTDISEEFLSALQHACEERHIPEDLLNRMADMDPNEVFSIVEALGLVRPFNIALEAIQAPTPPAANGVFTAFGVDTARRALDLD